MLAFHRDSYLSHLPATVVSVEGNWVRFDDTIFYPTGGGQPADFGEIKTPGGLTLAVTDVRKGDDGVLHELADASGLDAGDVVALSIDWVRRHRLMRMHTALHLLGSLVPVPVTGGQVGVDRSRLDFNLGDLKLDKEDLTTRMNALVQAGHPLEFGTITEMELEVNPGLVRTMSVSPPRGVGDVRTVRVVGVDYQPCGGTHVRNTSEIGMVTVAKIENKGKQNRRVHVVLGE